jgi:hypothetical protein
VSLFVKVVVVIFSPFIAAWFLRRQGTVLWEWTDRRWGAVMVMAAIGTALALASDSGTALVWVMFADWFVCGLWTSTWPPDSDPGD